MFNYVASDLDLAQATSLFSSVPNLPTGRFEMAFQFNIGSANALFNERVFTQNSLNNEQVDISLVINEDIFSSLLSTLETKFDSATLSYLTDLSTTGSIPIVDIKSSFNASPLSFGNRLLEVTASKLFGNANAVSFINNDNAYLASKDVAGSPNQVLYQKIVGTISGAGTFSNTDVSPLLDIYNYYTESELDKTGGTFNFYNSDWLFPINFSSHITVSSGGDYAGPSQYGNVLTDGVNVLLYIHSTD